MDMKALDAVQARDNLQADDAAVMLDSGHELGKRIADPARQLRLWQKDVRKAWVAMLRFKVWAARHASVYA